MKLGKMLLVKCHEVWVLGEKVPSYFPTPVFCLSGMEDEIAFTKWMGMTIQWFDTKGMEIK